MTKNVMATPRGKTPMRIDDLDYKVGKFFQKRSSFLEYFMSAVNENVSDTNLEKSDELTHKLNTCKKIV